MQLGKIDKEKKRNIIIDIDDKMILYRTKYYAAADILKDAKRLAKVKQQLINKAKRNNNHSLAEALQNATEDEFAAYLHQRDKAAVLAKTETSDVKSYVGGVKTAKQNYNSLLDKNGNINWAANGEATHDSYAARRLVEGDNTNVGYKVVNGKPVWVNNQNIEHLGQSKSLTNNLKSEYRNLNDGDGADMWDWTDIRNGGSTARYLGDFKGSDRMINQINKGNSHYANFVDSNSKLGQVMSGKGSYSQGADEALVGSVKNRQAAAAKAEQERAAKAAEEQRKAAEQAKIQQMKAEEQARKEAAAKAAEEQRRAEEEARKRRQQAEAASREKEEQRRQEHLNREKDRSQRKGLYTGLGIAGGVAAAGAGAYYLANRNNRKDDR